LCLMHLKGINHKGHEGSQRKEDKRCRESIGQMLSAKC
jgi:hypothetical protein